MGNMVYSFSGVLQDVFYHQPYNTKLLDSKPFTRNSQIPNPLTTKFETHHDIPQNLNPKTLNPQSLNTKFPNSRC